VISVLKIAVCDDEPFMREDLSAKISDYIKEHTGRPCHIVSFPTGRVLLEDCRDFDLIFLDIQMQEPDGMETARMLRKSGNHSLLIFITVLKECVFDAFEVRAFDYLLKPIAPEQLERTLDRAVKALNQTAEQSLLIQKGGSCQIIGLSQILYCEVIGRKVYLHLVDGQVIDYYEKLEKLEAEVGGQFFRCHRSYLVNLDYVCGYSKGQALLPQEHKIPVSRLRGQDLTQALLRHMKTRKRKI